MKKKNIDYYLNLPYNIIIRKDPYGGYFAKVEELEGCMTQGETYEETFKNIREAMELWPFLKKTPHRTSSWRSVRLRLLDCHFHAKREYVFSDLRCLIHWE